MKQGSIGPKRAVFYARVSTNGQKDNYSFATQRADCERYVQQRLDLE
jgi:DNA invertase Pin-like site-specific DNA recombinase